MGDVSNCVSFYYRQRVALQFGSEVMLFSEENGGRKNKYNYGTKFVSESC